MQLRYSIAAAIGTLIASAAFATTNDQNGPNGAHYRNGFGEPTCQVTSTGVSCTGTAIDGIGNRNGNVVLTALYSATVTCTNGGNQVVEVKTQTPTAASEPGTLDPNRNGSLIINSLSVTAPTNEQVLASVRNCTSGNQKNWTKTVTGSPTISSYTYNFTFNGFSQPYILFTGP